jgi:4-hydroxybenzoate polyprenyltransferase
MTSTNSHGENRLLAYCQLIRLPNVFTALADVAMGFVVARGSMLPLDLFFAVLVASACLYSGGMTLNDVCDVEQDGHERPQRPLPSGRVSLQSGSGIAWTLLAVGLLAAAFAAAGANSVWPMVVAGGLTGLIVVYDAVVKLTPLGPITMGGCRGLNVLLGMSMSATALDAGNLLVVGGMTAYVTGLTWFARREARTSERGQLIGALLVMWAGMTCVWLFPQFEAEQRLNY